MVENKKNYISKTVDIYLFSVVKILVLNFVWLSQKKMEQQNVTSLGSGRQLISASVTYPDKIWAQCFQKNRWGLGSQRGQSSAVFVIQNTSFSFNHIYHAHNSMISIMKLSKSKTNQFQHDSILNFYVYDILIVQLI